MGISGISQHKSVGTLLDFTTGWGKGKVFEWLSSLSEEDRMITKLQIRVAKGTVPHRFVVLYTQNGKVHRFDRRPMERLAMFEGPTKDEYIPDLGPKAIDEINLTVNEVELLDLQVDLRVVVAICFEIAQDPKSRQYSLFTHNCFFFSWTIFMGVARHCLPYTKPGEDVIVQSFVTQHIAPVRDFLVKAYFDYLSFVIIQTVTMFRSEVMNRPAIAAGMPLIMQLGWKTPDSILRLALQYGISLRVHFGLKGNFEKHVEHVLRTKITEFAKRFFEQPETHRPLDGKLWLNDLNTIVGPAVEQEVVKMVWQGFTDGAIAFGDEVPIRETVERSTAGRRGNRELASWEHSALLMTCLHEGIRATRMAAKAEEDEQLRQSMAEVLERYKDGLERQGAAQNDKLQSYNRDMIKLIWETAGKEALSSTQKVMEDIYKLKEDDEESTGQNWYDKEVRKKMWDEIWIVWDVIWDRGLSGASEKAAGLIAEAIDRMNIAINAIVKEQLQNATVSASIPNTSLRPGSSPMQKSQMTNGQLQDFMHRTMREATGLNLLNLVDLNDTMARIWSKVRTAISA